jgi:NADH:ubiquinone oxidoreductase subunit E
MVQADLNSSQLHAAYLDSILERHGYRQENLLQILRETQEHYGWLHPDAIDHLSRTLRLPLTKIEGVASFYAFLYLKPHGKYRVLFSDNITDRMLGNVRLLERMCSNLWIERGKLSEDGLVSVDYTSCTGMCDQGPAMLVNNIAITRLSEPRVDAICDLIRDQIPLAEWPEEFFDVSDNIRRKAGDTKVVERGKGDGVFISTTAIGVLPEGVTLAGHLAQPGDSILLSGTIADHGMAIISQRENLSFDAEIVSDSAALHGLVAAMLETGARLRVMRDPTRGGVAATLNEIAMQSEVGMVLRETAIPIQPAVAAACEFLGLDPLYIANEGKLLAICAPEDAERLLATMRRHPLGHQAAIIGEVIHDDHRFVQMQTAYGSHRIVDWLSGEQLPRIC